MEKRLGLNNLRYLIRGYSLRYKIRTIRYELKYAWQRAWRGYDDGEVWDLGYALRDKLEVELKDFRKNSIALLNHPDGSGVYSEAETNAILDSMIESLQFMDEDYVSEKLFPNEEKDYKRINEVMRINQELFIKNFDDFWFQLWY